MIRRVRENHNKDQDTLLGVGWGVLIWIHSGRIQVCALADIKLECCEY